MRPSSLRSLALAPILVGSMALLAASCAEVGALGDVAQAACPEIRPDVDAVRTSYSDVQEANIKLRAFIQASKDLAMVAERAEAEAAEACSRMAFDLGVPQQQIAPQQGPGGRAAGPCNALASAIDAILRTGIQVRVQAMPPQCEATATTYAQCAGTCQAQVDPGEIVARCEPARLSGFCQGQCGGRCEGRCSGQCNGQCSAVDAQGRCAGQCNGQCVGSCDATCHAYCQGTWQAPRCEGQVRGPSADAQCDASCKAHASFRASCTPGMVNVQANANAEMATRLVNTLQKNMPLLLHAQIGLGQRVLGEAEMLARVGADLPSALGQAGAHAIACVGAGANASANATASLRVTVNVSASVSGRVGAGG
ncbi:MAG TPA: hypothetical protein VE093_19500 [Polyangiaceae bacterium]|nr:hypothetical protein [Polyangiaceae bacterium]